MAITLLDASATVVTASTVTLPLGSNWVAGDLRIVRLSRSASGTFGTSAPSGWTMVAPTGSVSRYAVYYYRYLQAGDTAPTVTRSDGSGGHSITAITARGAQAGLTLSPTPAGASATPTASTWAAPSVSTGAGFLLTWHEVTRTAGANSWSATAPSGMTLRASTASDSTGGYNVMLASEARSSGASGARTATPPSNSATWSTSSLFLAEATAAAVDYTPTLVNSYVSATGNNSSDPASVTVPNVVTGDWIVAMVGAVYKSTSATVGIGGTGSGSWVDIGSRVGDSSTYANYTLVVQRKIATAGGTHTVTSPGTTDEIVLAVLHLRDVNGVDGTPVQAAVTQSNSDTVLSSAAVSPSGTKSLLVFCGGLVWFNDASASWSTPSGMTKRVDTVTPGPTTNHFLVATQVLTSAGSTGTRSATSSATPPTNGEASKMFALSGTEPSNPPDPDPVPATGAWFGLF